MTGGVPNVAFAASRDFPALDDGWPSLREATGAVGLRPSVAVWDDPGVDWSAFSLVVPVYAWGWVTRRSMFLQWVDAVSQRAFLLNGPPLLLWNSDKAYLADLAAAGIPTVATVWVRPGETWQPPGDDYVIKPSVASGGLEAARYLRANMKLAQRHIDRLHAQGQTVMVQPYLPAVDTDGETALVFFGDRYSHAISKQGLLIANAGTTHRLWEREVISPRTPRTDQHDLAAAALDVVHQRLGPTTYARVDVVDDNDGRPVINEVELIEPSLFFEHSPHGADRLAHQLRLSLPA